MSWPSTRINSTSRSQVRFFNILTLLALIVHFAGVVKKVYTLNDGGTCYDIRYNDGDMSLQLQGEFVRRLKRPRNP